MKFNDNYLFYRPETKRNAVPPTPTVEIPKNDWRNKYNPTPDPNTFVKGNSSDDSETTGMVQLEVVDNTKLVEGKPGKVYLDKADKKVKIFIDASTGWKDISYT